MLSCTPICFFRHCEGEGLATPQELAQFLQEVERRAFKHAVFAVQDEHLALDLVQDAMLKLAEKYGSRPLEELPLLFQRILQNIIRDSYRRQRVRNFWTSLLSGFGQSDGDGDEIDPLEVLTVADESTFGHSPERLLADQQTLILIEQAVANLPARQREAFLLRYWEELDVAQTAQVMNCSEGSVKTHCSRAVQALATYLTRQGITLADY